MTLTCLTATCERPALAEHRLSEHMPGRDVQLMPLSHGRFLLPPQLLGVLEERLDAPKLTQLLAHAGLGDVRHESWLDIARELLEGAESWAGELAGLAEPSVASDPGALTWHLDMCKVREAWLGLGGPYDIAWGDLRVGQVDTGYTEHPVFGFPDSPSIDVPRARTFGDDAGSENGRDPLTGGNSGHGTASGSLISAYDLATPCLGVAPRARMIPARISDCVVIDQRADEFEAAIHYLVDEAGVQVVNVSMGTFSRLMAPMPMSRAVDHCYRKGVILVCAAGNVPIPGWPAFPARLARSIAVAGVTRERLGWAMSSSGSWVDLSAPAKSVWRASTAADGRYGFTAAWGGTTFAAAMTSGAAALWLHAHADRIADLYREPWQRVEAFRLMARRVAQRPAGWSEEDGWGAGILDVAAMMRPEQLPSPGELQQR